MLKDGLNSSDCSIDRSMDAVDGSAKASLTVAKEF